MSDASSASETAVQDLLAALPGDCQPLRDNGYLTFGAPWQARALGIASALYASDAPAHLVDHLRRDLSRRDDYYASWVAALLAYLEDAGAVTAAELDARMDALSRVDDHAGHDHA
jgi:hypothetical protein